MAQKLKNNARALLTSAILAGDTSLVVEAAKADSFPAADTGTDAVGTFGKDWFKIVLQDTAGNIEIAYVRTRPAGTATMSNVLRGQEGTTARDYAAGSIVGLRITAQDVEDAISLASMATTVGEQIVSSATQAAARTAIGATATGQAVMTAADAAAARTALNVPATDGTILNATNAAHLTGSWAAIPAGTKMLFQQTAAPPGWTKDTTNDQAALRVVSGTAGSGGTVDFTTAFASQPVTGTVGSTTLALSQIPSHGHTLPTQGSGDQGQSTITINTGGSLLNGPVVSTNANGSGGSHTHSFTGTAINLAVKYVDTIIATKD